MSAHKATLFTFIFACLTDVSLLHAQGSFVYRVDHPMAGVTLQLMDVSRIGPDLYSVAGRGYQSNASHFYRFTINASGTVLDGFISPLDTNAVSYPATVLHTQDGGHLFTYLWIADGTDKQVFLKTDAAGNVEWNRYYPDNYGIFFIDHEHGIVEKDGGYFVLGHKQDVPINTGWPTMLLHMDGDGQAIGTLSVGDGDYWTNAGRALIHTRSNGLIMATVQAPYWGPSYYRKIALHRWNAALDLEWSKAFSFGLGNLFNLTTVTELSDGGCVLGGGVSLSGGSGESFLFKVDSTGQVAWGRRWTLPGPFIRKVVEEPDGSLVMLGQTIAPSALAIAHLDSAGALIDAYVADQLPPITPLDMVRDSATGEHLIRGYPNGIQGAMFIARLDSTFHLDCGGTPLTWSDTLILPDVEDPASNVLYGTLASFDSTAQVQPVTFVAQDLCLSTTVPAASRAGAMEVWPIPTSGRLFVRWTERPGSPGVLFITDLAGRTVMERSVAAATSGVIELDLSPVHPGPYILSMTGDDALRAVIIKE